MDVAVSGGSAVCEAPQLVGAVEVADDGQVLFAVVVWLHAERTVGEREHRLCILTDAAGAVYPQLAAFIRNHSSREIAESPVTRKAHPCSGPTAQSPSGRCQARTTLE